MCLKLGSNIFGLPKMLVDAETRKAQNHKAKFTHKKKVWILISPSKHVGYWWICYISGIEQQILQMTGHKSWSEALQRGYELTKAGGGRKKKFV